MKIKKGAGPKATKKIAPTVPSAPLEWKLYWKRMEEFERYMTGRIDEFFLRAFNLESATFEVRETAQAFRVSADMPGFKESEIEIRAEPRRLFLHAKHEESIEKKGEPVSEEKEFTRWVNFPAEVNPEKVEAVLSKGVLEVMLEKAQAAKKVEVHSKAA